MTIEIQSVALPAGQFSYRVTGDADAPPVVLLHALGLNASDWDAVARALAGDWRVYALDQRGHGSSARPGSYSFEAMRDDLRDFLDAVGTQRVRLVGHSMGGTVAYLFAEAWPERVERLVVEDTGPLVGAKRPLPPETAPEPVDFDWPVVPAIVRQLNEPDPAWRDRLCEITAPTLVIGGGSTSTTPQHLLADVVARVQNGRLVTLEGAGHYVHATCFDEFMAEVGPFLAGDDGRQPRRN